ncbi:MAG: MATE family efflux transporter [Lachnospiraceae bacterium]|nr:MATE family efflux transporter [Lachnospiraceae bacterium]
MKKMALMSIPIFIELFLQLLVGNVDQIMISRYSQNAVGAIGNGNQIMSILIIFLNVMGSGTTIVLARFLGANNKEKIAETCTTSIFMLTILGFVASFLLVVFHLPIFRLMNVPEEIIKDASNYMSIIGICTVVQAVYIGFGAILRSYAMNSEITVISFVMNILNVIGNGILIYGLFGLPSLGIVGVAISTNISKCIGLFIIVMVFRKKLGIRLSVKYLKPLPKDTIGKILSVAIPSGAEGISYNLSQIVVLGVVNTIGGVLGAYVINTKVYVGMAANVAYIYSVAIAGAMQVVIGYLVGANRKDLVAKKVWAVQLVATVVSVGISIILYFQSDLFFGLFTKDERVLSLAHQVLLVEIFLEIGRSINIVMVKALIATGDVKFPVVCGIVCQWVVAALFSYIFGILLNLGLTGVWIALAMDECVRGFIYVIRFKMEKWKTMKTN